jgi:Na+-translocating ferredoxin:NAD+ oxidoreductase RnfD subunit
MTEATLRAPWARLNTIHPRYLIVFFITLILVVGEWRYAILGGYDRLAAALAACVVTEAVCSRMVRGRFVNLASAYVSGISLSLLLKPQAGLLWPFALGGVLAIGSKYVLVYRDRHLFNPSNFAISALLLLAPGTVAILSHQATNAVIWAVGLLVVWRARMLHVTLTYVVSFLLLAAVRTALVGGPLLAEIAPITGPMYQLFIFFMVTDPRTTVGTRRARIVVASLVAVVEALIRLAGDYQVGLLRPLYPAPPILALFLVGPVAMWVDLWRGGHRRKLGTASTPR